MKNLLSLLAFVSLLCCATQVRAQYVTIPDANFRTFLQQQYPACFNAQGLMDTTCAAVTAATQMDCSNQNIANLTGVQYFDDLQNLNCSGNFGIVIGRLPDALALLDCSLSNLTNLPTLPMGLQVLNCSFNSITDLLSLPMGLQYLNCNGNFITMLNGLPDGLLRLDCGMSDLLSLPNLPSGLVHLDCQNCGIMALPTLPNTLTYVDVQNAHLNNLPSTLPPNLEYFSVFNNPELTCLPPLPVSLWALITDQTQITCIPNYTNTITSANAPLPLCIPNTCLPALCDGSGLDCVFPGDTNHDGVCNNFDVLPISVLDGQVGVARTNASTNWYGQPCANWNVQIPNTTFDAKFADANGGNKVDSMDINVVYTNYNRTNNGTIPTNRGVNNTNAVFPISIAFTRDTFNISLSDTITADIFVGNTTLAATNFYGFAASITYDSTLFKPLSIQYNNASFMGSDVEVNVFGINNAPAQQYDIALARRTRTNITGQGKVARIKGIIAENVASKNAHFLDNLALSFGIGNVLAINNQNQSLPTTTVADQCVLSGVTVSTENNSVLLDKSVAIVPNPVRTNGVLQINAKNCTVQRVELSDMLGKLMLSQTTNSDILIQNLPPAVYFARIYTDKGIVTKKIVVQ